MEMGSLACCQDKSERGPPIMQDKASLLVESNSRRRSEMREGSVVRRMYTIFGRAKQLRRRTNSRWGWWREGSREEREDP